MCLCLCTLKCTPLKVFLLIIKYLWIQLGVQLNYFPRKLNLNMSNYHMLKALFRGKCTSFLWIKWYFNLQLIKATYFVHFVTNQKIHRDICIILFPWIAYLYIRSCTWNLVGSHEVSPTLKLKLKKGKWLGVTDGNIFPPLVPL